MKYITENMNKIQSGILFIKALPVYEFLLSIEKSYQENEKISSLSYNYKDNYDIILSKKVINDIKDLALSINCFATDEDGFSDSFATTEAIENIGKSEYNYSYTDSLFFSSFKHDIEDILRDFSLLENRDDRFNIYRKFLHGKMPGYKNVLENWKNKKIENILDDGSFISYYEITLEKDKKTLNLAENIKKLNEELGKFSFLNFYFGLKKSLYVNDTFRSLMVSVEMSKTDVLFSVENIDILDNQLPNIKQKLHLDMNHLPLDFIIKKPHYNKIKINHKTKLSSLHIDYLNIDERKFIEFDAFLEKFLITEMIRNNNETDIKKTKRL